MSIPGTSAEHPLRMNLLRKACPTEFSGAFGCNISAENNFQYDKSNIADKYVCYSLKNK